MAEYIRILNASGEIALTNPLAVSLATQLSAEFNTIDVAKMSKGGVTVAHNAITATATSDPIDCRGFNALDIQFEISGSGKWNLEATGSTASEGTYKSQYVGPFQSLRKGLTANTGFTLPVSANYAKIVATEVTDGATVTVKATPVNMPVNHTRPIRETQIGSDQTASWLASAVANTQVNIDITKPDNPCEVYQTIVMNPSKVTDLTVDVKTLETSFASETRGTLITSFSVPKATSAVLHDCETAWTAAAAQGAHVVCTADAVTYKVGAKSAKMAMDADAATGLLASAVITSANLTDRTHVQFWLRSSVDLSAGDLQFLIDDTALCASPLETINIPAIAANEWTLCTLRLVNPTSDLACICVGVSQVVDKGAFDLYIDDVNSFKPGWNVPLVTGLFNGSDLRFSFKNDTTLGANDAFSATLRLKEYK